MSEQALIPPIPPIEESSKKDDKVAVTKAAKEVEEPRVSDVPESNVSEGTEAPVYNIKIVRSNHDYLDF